MQRASSLLLLASLLIARLAHHQVRAHGVALSTTWRRAKVEGIISHDVDYIVDNVTYQGYVALPKVRTPWAAVLVGHQFLGLGEYEKARTDEMAKMGYAAFAVDVYGKGVRCNTTACGFATCEKVLSNIPKLRGVIDAGVEQLVEFAKPVTKDKFVALGYCFGGAMVLDIARRTQAAGITFAAVSSFHGTLPPWDKPAAPGTVVTNVQAHHAELDFQGGSVLLDLEKELSQGVNGTDAIWETIKYAKCEHGWTEPNNPIYNARAAVQSHKSTFEFFEMALGKEDPSQDAFPIMPFCTPAAELSR